MLQRSHIHVTFLKWFASPLEFSSGSLKKLEDTGVSDKYKNTYQRSHVENKIFCQNPAVISMIRIHATK